MFYLKQVRAGFQGASAQPRAAWAQESWARSSPGTTEKGPSVYQLFRREQCDKILARYLIKKSSSGISCSRGTVTRSSPGTSYGPPAQSVALVEQWEQDPRQVPHMVLQHNQFSRGAVSREQAPRQVQAPRLKIIL